MFELGMEALLQIPINKKRISKIKEKIDRLIVYNEEMDIEEFIELYDTRIYDFNNKQDDIKILKHIDFEGVYIITNYDKNYNYIGLSDKVFRTVDRYLEDMKVKKFLKIMKMEIILQ